MDSRSSLIALLLLLFCMFTPRALGYERESGEYDFGPIASRKIMQDGTPRFRALGPVFESQKTEGVKRFGAVRPLYSMEVQPRGDRWDQHWLWPLATRYEIDENVGMRILLAWYMNADREDSNSAWRFWLLPFYFQGRNSDAENYVALFPVAGSIKGIFLQDELRFFLFPLKLDYRINDVETSSWLWPFISNTEGDGVDRSRFWPFYGRSIREGDFDKRFILWPFYNSVRYEENYGNGKAWILFPITGHLKLEDQEGWWVIPPFFRFHKGERQDRVYCPWPFVQWERGDVNKFYLFPLYGTRHIDQSSRQFFLWPLGSHRHMDGDRADYDRWTFWPVWFTDDARRDSDPVEKMYTYRKIWPLFSYKTLPDRSRLRIPDLWPARDHRAVDRNWAPFWTLYEYQRSGNERETELLWGMFRKQTVRDEYHYFSIFPLLDMHRDFREDRSGWTLLKGLMGREKVAGKTKWKLLYFFHWGK